MNALTITLIIAAVCFMLLLFVIIFVRIVSLYAKAQRKLKHYETIAKDHQKIKGAIGHESA